MLRKINQFISRLIILGIWFTRTRAAVDRFELLRVSEHERRIIVRNSQIKDKIAQFCFIKSENDLFVLSCSVVSEMGKETRTSKDIRDIFMDYRFNADHLGEFSIDDFFILFPNFDRISTLLVKGLSPITVNAYRIVYKTFINE